MNRPIEMSLYLPQLALTLSYALYSSLSPGFQKYLEGLEAVHSGVAQAEGARAAGLPVRRKEIESVHPVVRVHPATGWKSVYVNPGKLILRLQWTSITLLLPQVSPGALWAFPRRNQMLF